MLFLSRIYQVKVFYTSVVCSCQPWSHTCSCFESRADNPNPLNGRFNTLTGASAIILSMQFLHYSCTAVITHILSLYFSLTRRKSNNISECLIFSPTPMIDIPKKSNVLLLFGIIMEYTSFRVQRYIITYG